MREPQLSDQLSRNRIFSELQRNLLVEAGAGSGKTYEMSRRMAAGIATGDYQVEHLAAVTFTRKAAAELRGRFQLALETELKLARATECIKRTQHALSNLDRFFAGTIHSFCGRLLRERPVEAGVSPGFSELDEIENSLLRSQSWRDFLAASKAAGDPTVLELREAGITPKELDRAFETVCLYEDVEFPPGNAPRPDTAPGFEALDQFWAALCKELPSEIMPETTCKIQQTARDFRKKMKMAGHRSKPGTLAALLDVWDSDKKIVQKWWSEDTATRKRINAEIRGLHQCFRAEVVIPFLASWRQYIYRLSVTLLTNARGHAAIARQRANTLNYDDLLQLTARVLRSNADVRRALREKYRWLFVDEFQDTDPVQAEIIFLLAGVEAVGGDGADWRSIPLRPGSLFVVGDPKQSIYRFRRADIDIYNIVRAKLMDPNGGEVLQLTTNFRSVPALCEWANEVFRQQFPPEPTAHSPKFAPLEPHRAAGEIGASGVFTLTVPASIEQREIPQAEAERIARYIRSEVDAGPRTFGDFLILTRKRKNLGCYVAALEALQVPVEVSGAGAFGASREVAQLALLLRALSDPQDGTSLVGVLRGPLFGISDPDLFAFRQAGGWFSLFSDVESEPVSQALTSLRQMYRWTRLLPAGAALERVLEHTGYLALAATTPGGVEAGDLLHAIDRVRQITASGQSLAEAAAALEADCDGPVGDVESLPLEPGRDDVVRVMNLHKAKGLESPVVFLADPCGGFKPPVDVRIIRDGASACGYFCIKRKNGEFSEKVIAAPLGWAQYEADERDYLRAEEHRLLYVAGTRARDQLVVGRWARGAGRSTPAWAAFNPFLTRAPELAIPATASAPASQKVDLSAGANARAYIARLAAHKRSLIPSWSATSVTAEARHIAKMARSLESDADDPTRAFAGGTPSQGADAGMAWGTLIHGLLEHAMRHKDASRADLTRLAMWLTFEQPELRPVLDEAVRTVEEFTRSPFWQLASRADHAMEVPFQFAENANSFLTGVIDLVFNSGENWEVVDYKTDVDLGDVRATQRYAYQLAAYQRALAACGVPNSMASIRSVRASNDVQ
jgi:ATP-dependent helicase/nuclease subunit A